MAKKSPHPNIYGICGYKGSGKDTLAKMVVKFNGNFTVLHFADDLKKFASEIFGIEEKYFHDVSLKEVSISPVVMDDFIHSMKSVTGLDILPRGKTANTPREVLQYFGTEYVRSVEDNYWVDRVVSKVKRIGSKVLIPDVRFPNEVEAVRKCGGLVLRTIRLSQKVSSDAHASEAHASSIVPDIEIASVEGNLTIPRGFAYNVAMGKSKILHQFDYRLFSKCRDLYLSGHTFSEVGRLVGIKGIDKKGARGIVRKCFEYYGVRIRGNGMGARKLHRFIEGHECKQCSHCSGWKNLEEFNYSSRTWDDLFSICRKCQSEYNKRRHLSSKDSIETVFKNSKKNSTYRKIDFTISLDRVKDLWEKSGGKCAYTGESLTFSKGDLMRATLDRLDSSLGYIDGNVVWCSYAANVMKGPNSVDVFRKLADLISRHMEKGSL